MQSMTEKKQDFETVGTDADFGLALQEEVAGKITGAVTPESLEKEL